MPPKTLSPQIGEGIKFVWHKFIDLIDRDSEERVRESEQGGQKTDNGTKEKLQTTLITTPSTLSDTYFCYTL